MDPLSGEDSSSSGSSISPPLLSGTFSGSGGSDSSSGTNSGSSTIACASQPLKSSSATSTVTAPLGMNWKVSQAAHCVPVQMCQTSVIPSGVFASEETHSQPCSFPGTGPITHCAYPKCEMQW